MQDASVKWSTRCRRCERSSPVTDSTQRRSLGQNFLFDLNLTARIARAAGPFDDTIIVEIGPGPGGLTRALLEQGARVIAVERDPRCLPALEEIAAHYPGRLTIVEGDALEIDIAALVRTHAPVIPDARETSDRESRANSEKRHANSPLDLRPVGNDSRSFRAHLRQSSVQRRDGAADEVDRRRNPGPRSSTAMC